MVIFRHRFTTVYQRGVIQGLGLHLSIMSSSRNSAAARVSSWDPGAGFNPNRYLAMDLMMDQPSWNVLWDGDIDYYTVRFGVVDISVPGIQQDMKDWVRDPRRRSVYG